jgi:hypothetical protein
VLVVIVQAVECAKLNGFLSRELSAMNINDTIVSTLGHFKATLINPKCRLQIEEFLEGIYTTMGYYDSPNSQGQDCRFLSFNLSVGSLVTSEQYQFAFVKGPCESMLFTIDDTGLVRLTCVYEGASLPPAG